MITHFLLHMPGTFLDWLGQERFWTQKGLQGAWVVNRRAFLMVVPEPLSHCGHHPRGDLRPAFDPPCLSVK
jgi:hypothetical protein